MARPEKIRLGDLLIQQSLITPDQLQFALEQQKQNGHKLGRVLVDNHFISEERMSESLARQLDIPYVNLRNFNPNLELVRSLSESLARRYRALLLEERKDSLLVGMADPTDLQAFDELGVTLKRSIDIAVVTEGQLLETIDRVYRRSDEISGLARGLSGKAVANEVDFGDLTDAMSVDESPAISFLQALLGNAARAGASSIHLELLEGHLHTRFRIGGQLQLQPDADGKIAATVMVRLRMMAGLDAAEKHLPQDGRFNVRVRNQAMEIRISSIPARKGESLVLRLSIRGEGFLPLDRLGMPAEMLARYREIVRCKNGMILVAGSGDMAVLYASLEEIRATERKIITVEAPVECDLPDITQTQVSERAGLHLAEMLRSALQQDPDVILVGELRDPETARISLRTAMDDRLVFSTISATAVTDALTELMDLGISQRMMAASLRAVLAQRRLRRVCEQCSEPHMPDTHESAWLKRAGISPDKLRHGRGCTHCNQSGYSGHLAVYEMLEMDNILAEAAMLGDVPRMMQAVQLQLKGRTLADHARLQLEQGRTTVAEVMRLRYYAEK